MSKQTKHSSHLRLYVIILLSHVASFPTTQAVVTNAATDSIQCKDPAGSPVDWFIAYKLPKLKESGNPMIKEGLGIAYILPGSNDWQISSRSINDSTSLVGMTLQSLYNKETRDSSSRPVAFILYNDQPPVGSTEENGGHMKGIILADSTGGIWLQHSVPHFIHLETPTYTYPRTGENNGQIFHCMNLKLKEVDNLGNILSISKPHIYNYSIPVELKGSLPILESLVNRREKEDRRDNEVDEDSLLEDPVKSLTHIGEADVNHNVIQIESAGRNLSAFAKGPSYHSEIYAEWIGPKYQISLDVQSWLNGHGAYPSNCSSSLKVLNIDEKKLSGNTFTTHDDHSKWAIGSEQPVVCIGDLNRMEHQKERGGAVNCFTDKNVWRAFKGIISTTQPCKISGEEDQPSVTFFGKLRNKIVALYRRIFAG